MSELFHNLACGLKSLFEFRYLGVYLHDPTRNVMRLQILESCEPDQWQTPSEVPIEGTVAGWVWENQKPLVVHDMETEHRFPASQALRHHSVRALCVMPLTTAHGRLGVLSIWSDNPGIYDQQDLEFAQLVAAQIAVALGAQTYQYKLSLEREHSKLLLEVNNTLVSNLNLRELISADRKSVV